MKTARRSRGFTVIELLAAITIIATLAGLGIKLGLASVLDARALACEKNRALLEDFEMKFQNDKGRASNSLSELVSGGYVNKATCPSSGVLTWAVTDPNLAWSHQALVCSVHGEHVKLRKGASAAASSSSGGSSDDDDDTEDPDPPADVGSGVGGGGSGGGGTTPTPPATKPPLLSDGFDGKIATGWTAAKGKSWNVTDGRYQVGSAKTPGKGQHTTFTGSESWTDYDVSVNARLDSGKNYSIAFRTTNAASPNGYVMQYTWSKAGGTFTIYRMTKGSLGAALASAAAPAGFDAAKGNDIRIEVRGSTFTGYVNGTAVVKASDKTYAAGAIGLRTTGTTSASFDNVKVTQP